MSYQKALLYTAQNMENIASNYPGLCCKGKKKIISKSIIWINLTIWVISL